MILKNTAREGLQKLIKHIDSLKKQDVYVGVTASSNGMRGNALIAMVMEYGSPVNKIPARSFLVSTIVENGDKYAKIIAETIPQAIKNGMSKEDAYARLGTMAMNDVKLKIVNGPFTPLKDATVKRKGSSKPLVDTGALRQSITWEVR